MAVSVIQILQLMLLYYNIAHSVAKIIPESLNSCAEGEPYVNIEAKSVASGQEFTGDITFPFEIDRSSEFTMNFRWWKDGEWEKNGKNGKGKVCFYLERFAASVWNDIKHAAQPKLEGDCTIPAGKYEFVNFVPDTSSFAIPLGGTGRGHAEFTIKKGDQTFCMVLIADIKN
ncbi:uncharacterized protein LOC116174675 [Photinus pyralis]|nr:uncharacterized protein LOC116174675 [Photinus pyralis]